MRPYLAGLLMICGAVESASALAQLPLADPQPAAASIPATFARSGHTTVIEFPLPIDKSLPNPVVLQAFGRTCSEPAAVRLEEPNVMHFEMVMPAVRVPTVLTVVSTDTTHTRWGEIVTYPARQVQFDPRIQLLASGAPRWFVDWAKVVGLPVTCLTHEALAAELSKRSHDQQTLLILGRTGAGESLAVASRQVRESQLNVLVLDANWFGWPVGRESVLPKHVVAGLTETARQRWPQPLTFRSCREAWPGVANRWSWINGADEPLVEQVLPYSTRDERQPAWVLSYLPWETQLGRDESADATFLELLTSAARATTPPVRTETERLYPLPSRPIDVDPVLSRLAGAPSGSTEQLYLLDVRGKRFPDEPLWLARELWERTPLLVLGDDQRLDDWSWLKLNRSKLFSDQPGVIWLQDDELPSSRAQQVRLMLKLSELGVPLAPVYSPEIRS